MTKKTEKIDGVLSTLILSGMKPEKTGDPAVDRTNLAYYNQVKRHTTDGGYNNKDTCDLKADASRAISRQDEDVILSAQIKTLERYNKNGVRQMLIQRIGMANKLTSTEAMGNILSRHGIGTPVEKAQNARGMVAASAAAAAKKGQDFIQFVYMRPNEVLTLEDFIDAAETLQGNDFILDYEGSRQADEEGRLRFGGLNGVDYVNDPGAAVISMKAKDEALTRFMKAEKRAREVLERQIELERSHPSRYFEGLPYGVEAYALAATAAELTVNTVKNAPLTMAALLRCTLRAMKDVWEEEDLDDAA